MDRATARRRKGVALLAAMLFLLVAASFHSAADNDLAGVGASRIAGLASLPATDTCAACNLDGLLTARLSLASPVAIPTAVEILSMPVPAAPFVAPRASVDSRPPPSA
jgi:hypothetical protein